MNGINRYILLLCSLIFLGMLQLNSVELNTYFSVDNFHFNEDNEISSSDYDFEYGEIITQEVSQDLFLDAGFTKSIINDYSIFTDFRIQRDLFGFNLGIFTNFLNDSSKMLTPGLNYGIDFLLPGVILVNLDLNNTIPNTSALEDGVSINNYKLKVGFYLGETIISANLTSDSNTKGTLLTSTATTNNKYFLNMDLFNKYSKYRISIDLGWNTMSRTITSLSVDEDDSTSLTAVDDTKLEAGSVYMNNNFTILVTDNITIDVGLLLHLVKFQLEGIDNLNSDEFSWGTSVGVTFKI